jgi:cell division initiation protein
VKITPIDISKQEFKKIMRGYDPIEVDTFLEMLGNEYEALIKQNTEYEDKIKQLEAELKNFKEVEKTLKQTLLNLQENSDKSRENSRKEADLIKKEAEIEAKEMVDKAKRQAQAMHEEMITMRTQKESLIARLRHILSSHLELLDILELDDADSSKLRDRTKKVFSQSKKEAKTEIKIETPETSPSDNVSKNPQPTEGANIFKNVFDEDMDLNKKSE